VKFRAIFLSALIFTASAFACCGHDTDRVPELKKIYILPEEVSIAGSSLLAWIDGHWQNVGAIFSDEEGLYIYKSGYEQGWYCNFCLKRHSCQVSCPYTGKEPPQGCR